jgi:hypothetical protein
MYFFIPVEGNPAFAVPDICIADVVEENIYYSKFLSPTSILECNSHKIKSHVY